MIKGQNPIIIRGARQHNLQGINLDLPTRQLIVLSGPSGSGKSSLAFDTLFAESRRRFLDCLSSQSRQALSQPDKPDVDRITGLPPSLCLEQSSASGGPRSLLGSITEILDYLRVLYAAIGQPHDPSSGVKLIRQSSDQIITSLLSFAEGTRLTLMAPIPATLWDNIPATLGDFQRQGFLRVRWDGDILDIDDLLHHLPDKAPQQAALVIDRIILRHETSQARLADSLQTALRVHEEEVQVLALPPDSNQDHTTLHAFHTQYRNPETGFILPQLTPKHFSFNSPSGACPTCKGLGTVEGKIGRGDKPTRSHTSPCPTCHAQRLNPLSLAVTISCGDNQEMNIAQLTALPLNRTLELIPTINIPDSIATACSPLLTELQKRLSCLHELGLGYLSLDRTASSLSGGELQRARLASQLGGGLSGVLYILDEPTIGLHPSDTNRLIAALHHLRDMGNTILVVEHDEQILTAADYIVDMGPGSGKDGGLILAQGTPGEIKTNPNSITGPWLASQHTMDSFAPLPPHTQEYLSLKGARAHNLQNVTLSLPLGAMTSITGPSGSGKSSLINECLIPALRIALAHHNHPSESFPQESEQKSTPWTSLTGANQLSRFVIIDQSPIGKSPRSTPATATGLLNILRPLYAGLPLSKMRGYNTARFSTNVRGGRCERCLGIGLIEVDMHFLSNVTIPCDACNGQRYNRETLEVTWRGKSIAQALAFTVDEALDFFAPIPKATAILQCLQKVGLGYMSLDRPSNTLSGGEAQRIKIAAELAKIPAVNLQERVGTPKSLFILDEPSSGLHFREIKLLLHALGELRAAGHTILCIEHNLDIIISSDHVIDMGPSAGEHGGQIVATGTPTQIANTPVAPTGNWLLQKMTQLPA
ncbi:MAG: excinuclease ABC subunit UvrA [Akkermansia sp.]